MDAGHPRDERFGILERLTALAGVHRHDREYWDGLADWSPMGGEVAQVFTQCWEYAATSGECCRLCGSDRDQRAIPAPIGFESAWIPQGAHHAIWIVTG